MKVGGLKSLEILLTYVSNTLTARHHFDVEPKRKQSRAVTRSHAQSRAVTRSHAQSRAVKRSHAQSSAVTRSHTQSSAVTRSHAQSRAVTHSHAQSRAVTRSQAANMQAIIEQNVAMFPEFSQAKIDDHKNVLNKIETRRSELKFLNFVSDSVLDPLKSRVAKIQKNLERAWSEFKETEDDHHYKQEVFFSFQTDYNRENMHLDISSTRVEHWMNSMKFNAIRDEIHKCRIHGLVVHLQPERVERIQSHGRPQGCRIMARLTPELLKRGGDYSEKPEDEVVMIFKKTVCLPGDIAATTIINQLKMETVASTLRLDYNVPEASRSLTRRPKAPQPLTWQPEASQLSTENENEVDQNEDQRPPKKRGRSSGGRKKNPWFDFWLNSNIDYGIDLQGKSKEEYFENLETYPRAKVRKTVEAHEAFIRFSNASILTGLTKPKPKPKSKSKPKPKSKSKSMSMSEKGAVSPKRPSGLGATSPERNNLRVTFKTTDSTDSMNRDVPESSAPSFRNFRKPKGRPPKNAQWNYKTGQWVQKDEPHEDYQEELQDETPQDEAQEAEEESFIRTFGVRLFQEDSQKDSQKDSQEDPQEDPQEAHSSPQAVGKRPRGRTPLSKISGKKMKWNTAQCDWKEDSGSETD